MGAPLSSLSLPAAPGGLFRRQGDWQGRPDLLQASSGHTAQP